MNIKITTKYQPITIAQIDNLRKIINVNLDQDYVNFLLNFNVGTPEKNKYINHQKDIDTSVEFFFGIAPIDSEDLIKVNAMYKDRIPNITFAIARAVGGDLICLDKNNGSILFWDHEKNDEYEYFHKDTAKLFVMEKSFNEFISKLEKDEDVVAPSKSSQVKFAPGAEDEFKKYMKKK